MIAIETLKASEVFSELLDEELQTILPLCREEHYDKGEYIYSKGHQADTFYLLREGSVQLEYEICPQPDACQYTAILVDKPGDVIGWSALVKPRRLTASAHCLSNVEIVAIDGKAMNELMEQDSHVGFVVMKGLAGMINNRLKEAKGLQIPRIMGVV